MSKLKDHNIHAVQQQQKSTAASSCTTQAQRSAVVPLDMQHLSPFLSVAYTKKDVVYRWKYGDAKAVELADDLKLSQFYLLAATGSNSTLNSSFGKPSYDASCF